MQASRLCVLHLLLTFALFPGATHGEPISGNVMEWLKTKPAAGAESSKPQTLQPEWIGTVKVALRHDPDKIHEDEKDDPMRLNRIWREKNGRVVIARVAKEGSYSAAARFEARLPTLKELDRVTKLSQLVHWFGPQHGYTDAWGGPDSMHWTESWTCFCSAGQGRLRWLSVFAHISAPVKAMNQAKVDILIVREGFLRPASPSSVREKAVYPTADAIADAEEREREAARSELPRPLRDLVAARQKCGDHELRTYTDMINRIRSDPRPELFNQLAARIDDGTCEIRGMAEDILSDERRSEGIPPWSRDGKTMALRHAVAALDHVPDHSSLEQWTALILTAIGGGRIDALGVEAKGGSSSFGDGTADAENLKAAKSATRREFETKFPILRSEATHGVREKRRKRQSFGRAY